MSAIEQRTTLEAARQADRSGLVEQVERRFGGVLVALPAAHAELAVREMLRGWRVRGAQVVVGAGTRLAPSMVLKADQWALGVPRQYLTGLNGIFLDDDWSAHPTVTDRTLAWWVFPRHCVRLSRSFEPHLRQALDAHTPEVLTDAGVPLPWVPAEAPTTSLGGDRSLEDDVELVAVGVPHAALPELDDGPLDPTDDTRVRAAFRRICGAAGFGDIPLDIARVTESRDGFVAGRVWLSKRGPERVRVDIGPNADAAEVWATLLHEVAHGLAPRDGHGRGFKRALVNLASELFGAAFFQVPAAMVGRAHAMVDVWLAVGVRAALNQAPAPTELGGDEAQLAKVVGRIQKLRRLARSQLGTPEGRSACAKANDLLVRWDLGAYSVRLAEGIDDQMCDRWVNIGKRSVWRRQLAFHVAEYCGVFCLSRKSRGWMHFFGRYIDVVTAEWFYEIWEAHIIRSADAHIKAYKARGGAKKHTRTERTNFCDSAVYALGQKLEALQARHDATAAAEERVVVRSVRAEAFAAEQFGLRGRRWSSATGKRVTVNAAGMEAGRQAPMGRGVGGPSGVRGHLKG